jgi:hypothetical protein
MGEAIGKLKEEVGDLFVSGSRTLCAPCSPTTTASCT